MINYKDSLSNMREARKRRQDQQEGSLEKESSSVLLPVEELRGQIFRKRQRRCNQKCVRFDLDKTTTIGDRNSTIIFDEHQTWLSPSDFYQIRMDMSMAVAGLQNGLLDSACARGLEAYLDPQTGMERLRHQRNSVARVLQQQSLLKAVMGKVNEAIIAKLSIMLSAPNVRRAMEIGMQDAEEAFWIQANAWEMGQEELLLQQTQAVDNVFQQNSSNTSVVSRSSPLAL